MPSSPQKLILPAATGVSEKHWRSLAKAASWRCTGTADTIVVSFLITGSIGKAFSIGGVEVLTKMLLYYLHERFWNRVQWGRIPPKPAEYEI